MRDLVTERKFMNMIVWVVLLGMAFFGDVDDHAHLAGAGVTPGEDHDFASVLIDHGAADHL